MTREVTVRIVRLKMRTTTKSRKKNEVIANMPLVLRKNKSNISNIAHQMSIPGKVLFIRVIGLYLSHQQMS